MATGTAFADLASFDSVLYEKLKTHILDHDFTPEYAAAIGDLDFDGLCPGGEGRAVANANKREYVALMAHRKLVGERAQQLDAIRRGFQVFDFLPHMTRFSPTDLLMLLMGPSQASGAPPEH